MTDREAATEAAKFAALCAVVAAIFRYIPMRRPDTWDYIDLLLGSALGGLGMFFLAGLTILFVPKTDSPRWLIAGAFFIAMAALFVKMAGSQFVSLAMSLATGSSYNDY